MEYRKLDNKELIEALPLVWNVFCEYEALDYPEYGKKAFWNAIHSDEYLNTLTAFGAFNEDKLIGIIASRNAGSHVALFFVDGTYHKQGVGKSLWNTFLYNNEAKEISVNSSLYAVDVYKKLGFSQTANAQEEDGIRYVPMVYKHLIKRLQDKDDKKAYTLAKRIGIQSAETNEFYDCFDDFYSLINAKSSYVRTRGFILCCLQARWDDKEKLKNVLPDMLKLLHDDKPTVVRQCLGALHEVALYRPELCEIIDCELKKIDLSKYKDTMAPLIEKDIKDLEKVVE